MPSAPSLDILYAFHTGHEYVVEVKRLDLASGADKVLVYHWLHVDSAQGNVRALGFRSMDASAEKQSRVFDNASLDFDAVSAMFTKDDGAEVQMANISAAPLRKNIMGLIATFLGKG
jgi:hypothetical protein